MLSSKTVNYLTVYKQTSSELFQNEVIYKQFTYKLYITGFGIQ